jgi:hypothetical protein
MLAKVKHKNATLNMQLGIKILKTHYHQLVAFRKLHSTKTPSKNETPCRHPLMHLPLLELLEHAIRIFHSFDRIKISQKFITNGCLLGDHTCESSNREVCKGS